MLVSWAPTRCPWFGGAVEGASDKVLNVAVPAGALVDDAAYALVDAANAADVVLVEATRRGKVIAGRLAAKLGLDTVAEGIEDERQLAFLQSVGCGLVQDYVFAEPLPFDEFERWADTRARAVASGAGSASRSVPGMPAASRNVRTAASMSR